MNEQPADSESTVSNLISIGNGAAVYFITTLAQTALGYLITLLLTRGLGPATYGTYAFAKTISSIFQLFAQLGAGNLCIRFLPENDLTKQTKDGIFTFSFILAFLGSVFFSLSLYFTTPLINSFTLENSEFSFALRIFSFTVPFMVLSGLVANVFQGLENAKFQLIIDNIIKKGVLLLILFIPLYYQLGLSGVMYAVLLSSIITSLIAIIFLIQETQFEIFLGLNTDDISRYLDFSLPLMLASAGSLLYTRVDLLLVGYFFSESDIGIYSVSILIASVITIPLLGFNQLFPPIASKLHSSNEIQQLNDLFKLVTKMSFSTSAIVFATIVIFRVEILAIFGEGFIFGDQILLFFALAHFTNSAVGPCGKLLAMTDHQRFSMLNQWITGILNAVLSYFFIIKFGLIGVAVGSAFSLAITNIIDVIAIYYFEGYQPYTINFSKPIFAVIISAVLMVIIRNEISGHLSLIIGSASGVTVFFILLLALGIEQREQQLIEGLLD